MSARRSTAAACLLALSPAPGCVPLYEPRIDRVGDAGPTGGGDGRLAGDGSLLPAALVVEPVYALHPRWLDFVHRADADDDVYSQPDVACSGDEDGPPGTCIHAGELRRVEVAGVAGCTGLTYGDVLEAFVWTCRDSPAGATLLSAGLRPDRRLADLVASGAWRPNAVVVRLGGSESRSAEAAWWDNPMAPLPVSATAPLLLDDNDDDGAGPDAAIAPGTVLFLEASAVSFGTRLDVDRVAVTMPPGVALRAALGAPGTMLELPGARFVWIEGTLDARGAFTHGLHLNAVRFSQFRGLDVLRAANAQIYVVNGSSGNLFHGGRVAQGAFNGIMIEASTDNVFRRLTLSGNAEHGAFALIGSARNVFVEIVSVANGNAGLKVSDSLGTIVSHVTLANNVNGGFYAVGPAGALRATQLVAINNPAGVAVENLADADLAQVVTSRNDTGILSTAPLANVRYRANLLVGGNGVDCAGAVAGAGLDADCQNEGASSAHVVVGGDAAASPTGRVLQDDPVSASDDAGAQPFAGIDDWVRLATSERAWGREGDDPADPALRGGCSTGCRIWDWSLRPTDTQLRQRSGDGLSPNPPLDPAQSCPTYVDGDQSLVAPSGQTFLINAVEWAGDGDGLCESAETCVLSPNFGAYQGHGAAPRDACVFQDGRVSGVRMLVWPDNGR